MFSPDPQLQLVNQFGEKTINYLGDNSNFVATHKASLSLTAAQVIALNASPQTLIAAVSGKTIQLVAMLLSYTYAAAFTVTAGKNLFAQYHGTAINLEPLALTGFLDQTANETATVFGGPIAGVRIAGTGIDFTSDDTGIAGGAGSTLDVVAYYNLL